MNKKKNKREFYAYVLFFSLYLGWSLVPKNSEFDCYRIVEIFDEWESIFPTFVEFIKSFVRYDSYFARDLYEGTIFSLVHVFSNNYHFVFLFGALFFTLFKLMSFNFFLRDYEHDKLHVIITFFFFTSIPLFQISGFRFFTAAWMAIYATLKIFIDEQKKFWYVLLLTPLVHITFLFYLFVVVISYFVISRIRDEMVVSFFFISIAISLFWDMLPQFSYVDGGLVGDMINAYVNDTYKAELDDAVNQSNYIRFFQPVKFVFYNIAAYLLYRNCKDLFLKKFILFVLSCLIIINCVGFIPSMSRFFAVFIPIILFVLNREVNDTKAVRFLVYSLPIVELFDIYQIYFTLYPEVLPDAFLLTVFR